MASSGSSSSRRTVISTSTLSFVLALCLPYTQASPLPSDSLGHPLFSNVTETADASQSFVSHLLSSTGGMTRQLWSRDVWTPPPPILLSSAISSVRPISAIAKLDANGFYRLPNHFVILKQRFNPGFIVLSYAIAFVGSLCTLELLIRRTTNSGWRNQALLASAGFTFGAVSTFAMHFIFNNSLSLHHPLQDIKNYPALRLAYDPGYTVLSLVASCGAMTIAFFIMGTSLNDWWCSPTARRRARSRSVSHMGKLGTDEYGRWKSSHKSVLRRGTVGMGALLFGRAGSAAKWNLMGDKDDELASSEARRKTSLGAGDEAKWGGNLDRTETDEVIRRDKKLQELEFRLGRSAVKEALVKKTGQKANQNPIVDLDSVRKSSVNPSRPFKTMTSPTFQNHVAAAPARPSSAPPNRATHSQEIFTPGFNFPARSNDGRASASPLSDIANGIGAANESLSPFHRDPPAPVEQYNRRASLPVVPLNLTRENPLRQTNTLTRIQSLPEGEPELVPSRQESSDRGSSEDQTTPSEEKVASLGESSDVKHVEFERKPVFTKLEEFLGFDVVTQDEIIKIFITGTVAGTGVVGMHYIGQLSITGLPYIAYKPGYVIGSVVIACGAVVIALYIMFIMLRPKLKHTWVSKIGVALILGIAVCGMHFCGMQGTIYAWPVGAGIKPSGKLVGTNKVITAIVAALAFLACIACAVFFILHSMKLRRERARRRRVVVAAVLLDPHDRVLVNSTDGMLPMCDIASLSGNGEHQSSRRSLKSGQFSIGSDSTVLGMDLSTGHEAFVSALKMSWGWNQPGLNLYSAPTVTEDVSSTSNQPAVSIEGRRGSLLTVESSVTSNRVVRLSVAKFLDRFASSSAQLAVQLLGQQDAISRLGVLYDQILTTGWVKLNNSSDTVSKGQLIFLVRRVNSSIERNDLLTKHFIFAEAGAVAATLHKTLSVPFDHTVPLLEDIKVFCDSTLQPTLKQGMVYAGVAVVQATPFDGLRILLEHDNRALLPMREICPVGGSAQPGAFGGSIEEIAEALTWLDGLSLMSIIGRNVNDAAIPGGERVAALLAALERTIVPMLDEMLDDGDISHLLPRLHIHPALIPLTPGNPRRSARTGYMPPYLIVFYANYDAAVNTFTDKWLPFSLFRAQNACAMAGRIAAAQKIEYGSNPQTTTVATTTTSINEGLPEEYEYSRRPSKVQFEFPDHSAAHSSPPTSYPPPQINGGLFGGFSFPPKSDVQGPVQSMYATPMNVPRRTAAAAAPRRSSLAPRSRFGSDAGESGERDNIAGVDEWDQDWLLTLLRTNLRTEF